jgi:carboxyl-terminal processing protease
MRYLSSLRWPARAGLCCLAAAAVTAATAGTARTSGAAQAASTPPACSPAQQASTPGPTTVNTIGQGYYCIFAHYYGGPVLDDRVLLAGATDTAAAQPRN